MAADNQDFEAALQVVRRVMVEEMEEQRKHLLKTTMAASFLEFQKLEDLKTTIKNEMESAVIKEIKQTGTVQEYIKEFENSIDSTLPESHQISRFLSGLKHEIKHSIRMFKPLTLYQAYTLAKLQEPSNNTSTKLHLNPPFIAALEPYPNTNNSQPILQTQIEPQKPPYTLPEPPLTLPLMPPFNISGSPNIQLILSTHPISNTITIVGHKSTSPSKQYTRTAYTHTPPTFSPYSASIHEFQTEKIDHHSSKHQITQQIPRNKANIHFQTHVKLPDYLVHENIKYELPLFMELRRNGVEIDPFSCSFIVKGCVKIKVFMGSIWNGGNSIRLTGVLRSDGVDAYESNVAICPQICPDESMEIIQKVWNHIQKRCNGVDDDYMLFQRGLENSLHWNFYDCKQIKDGIIKQLKDQKPPHLNPRLLRWGISSNTFKGCHVFQSWDCFRASMTNTGRVNLLQFDIALKLRLQIVVSKTKKGQIVQNGFGLVIITVHGEPNKMALIAYSPMVLNHVSYFQGVFCCPVATSLLVHNFCIYPTSALGHELGVAAMSRDEPSASVVDLSYQIIAILNHFRLGAVTCMGMMVGAYMISLFALKYKDRVLGLILKSSSWFEWFYNKWMTNLLNYGRSNMVKKCLLRSKEVPENAEVPKSDIVKACRRLLNERTVFDAMPESNAVFWTSIIIGIATQGLAEEATWGFYHDLWLQFPNHPLWTRDFNGDGNAMGKSQKLGFVSAVGRLCSKGPGFTIPTIHMDKELEASEILDQKIMKRGNRAKTIVLTSWKNHPQSNATLEFLPDLRLRNLKHPLWTRGFDGDGNEMGESEEQGFLILGRENKSKAEFESWSLCRNEDEENVLLKMLKGKRGRIWWLGYIEGLGLGCVVKGIVGWHMAEQWALGPTSCWIYPYHK